MFLSDVIQFVPQITSNQIKSEGKKSLLTLKVSKLMIVSRVVCLLSFCHFFSRKGFNTTVYSCCWVNKSTWSTIIESANFSGACHCPGTLQRAPLRLFEIVVRWATANQIIKAKMCALHATPPQFMTYFTGRRLSELPLKHFHFMLMNPVDVARSRKGRQRAAISNDNELTMILSNYIMNCGRKLWRGLNNSSTIFGRKRSGGSVLSIMWINIY